MARPKTKDAEARSFRIRKDLGIRLDDYSEWSHIPKTVIVELALEEYLNKEYQNTQHLCDDFIDWSEEKRQPDVSINRNASHNTIKTISYA